jgi:hypothetical protein
MTKLFETDVPVLSRGKHRNPRRGACFMEYASFLAGEAWSDHPSCTHPLLASIARHVNDCTTDANRSRLAPMVPSVIGLNPADRQVDPMLVLAVVRRALPVVSDERQHVLAVALLTAERMLDEIDGRPAGSLSEQSRRVLADVPQAARWARKFTAGARRLPRDFGRRVAPRAVGCAIEGVALACIEDPDDLLYTILTDAIAECTRWMPKQPIRRPAPTTVTV